MKTTDRPCEVFSVGEFILDELKERQWSVDYFKELFVRSPQDEPTIELILFCPVKGARLDEVSALRIGNIFGTSAMLWMKIDRAWHESVL